MASPINKFGVPLDSGRQRVMSQPKPKHKFRVILENFGIDTDERDYIAMEVDKVDRPSIKFETHGMKKFTGTSYYTGSHTWGEIKLVIRDVVSNNSTRAVYRQIQKQLDHHRRISRRSAQAHNSYHFKLAIETLGGANPDDTISNLARNTTTDIISSLTENLPFANILDKVVGTVNNSDYNPASTIEKWMCTGCVITDVNWDDMDYSESKYATITITIQPGYCVLYDNYKEMYSNKVKSSMGDTVDDFLNMADSVFGAVELGGSLLDDITELGSSAWNNISKLF